MWSSLGFWFFSGSIFHLLSLVLSGLVRLLPVAISLLIESSIREGYFCQLGLFGVLEGWRFEWLGSLCFFREGKFQASATVVCDFSLATKGIYGEGEVFMKVLKKFETGLGSALV